ncbi:MAG: hypothetical protein JRH17_14335, partial [Deltaproteobacteria bacterium]|nr:hypothetical protein [Deltaproteobacteria bacterium]
LRLVTLPFPIIGVESAGEAGPFSHDLSEPVQREDLTGSFGRQVEPWL